MENYPDTINNKTDRPVAWWLLTGCITVAVILIVGGLTRLHDAGLSITEWEVIGGTIPPMNEEQWDNAFETYKQFPEYQKLNRGMSMTEFKVIYWWEYAHRLLARLLGLIFIIPFAIFAWQGRFSQMDYYKLSGVFALGALQGLMGWYMVYSGLIDQPYVSHFRLAIHLLLAFVIFGVLWRYALTKFQGLDAGVKPSYLRKFSIILILLLLVQVILGAFTAGLDAGYLYPTFPKMGEHWIPPGIGTYGHLFYDLFNNPISVQFLHRNMAYVLVFAGGFFWYKVYTSNVSKPVLWLAHAFLAVLLLQVLTGVLTLLMAVPMNLAITHQFLALILFTILLTLEKQLSFDK